MKRQFVRLIVLLAVVLCITSLAVKYTQIKQAQHERIRALVMLIVKASQLNGEWSKIDEDALSIDKTLKDLRKKFNRPKELFPSHSSDYSLQKIAKLKVAFDEFDLDHNLRLDKGEFNSLKDAMHESFAAYDDLLNIEKPQP